MFHLVFTKKVVACGVGSAGPVVSPWGMKRWKSGITVVSSHCSTLDENNILACRGNNRF